jgi:hypothetical protein
LGQAAVQVLVIRFRLLGEWGLCAVVCAVSPSKRAPISHYKKPTLT